MLASKVLAETFDVLAPDGSEIRLMPMLAGGSMVHCRLPPGGCSLAVTHRTVEELWYVVSGEGEIWRRQGDAEQVTPLAAGTALSIPLGAHFQFRNLGEAPLDIVIVTMPPWPGMEEAVRVEDHWPVGGAG
ncbi:MAG TPA: cupin domain-containing protein [Geminicoccaceae bacterium]|nr:cupin domain-containing protein [Geminicoccus sp.]HMU50905.1 cupin domain-containing protein [Geminicoccaceae bacterium]